MPRECDDRLGALAFSRDLDDVALAPACVHDLIARCEPEVLRTRALAQAGSS